MSGPVASALTPSGFQYQNVPSTPAETAAPAFATGELEKGIRPTRWETIFETLRQAGMNSPVGIPGVDSEGALMRMAVQNDMEKQFDAEGRSKISAEEANKRYPGMPVPFSEPVYPELADLRASDQRRRVLQQEWIDRGPTLSRAYGAIPGGIAGLIGGIGGGPVGMIGGAALGAGLGAYGGLEGAAQGLDASNLALNFGVQGMSRALGLAPTVRTMFLENLLINAGTEIPSLIQAKREQQEINLKESAASVISGALLNTAIAKGFHFGLGLLERTPPAERESNLKRAIIQHENGEAIDTSDATNLQATRLAGAPRPGAVPAAYEFLPVEHPSERPYYAGTDANSGQHIPLSDFGDGVYASDNGMVPNNLASNPGGALNGQVTELAIHPDAKFLSLDEPLPKEVAARAWEELKSAGLADTILSKSEFNKLSGKEVLDYMNMLPQRAEGLMPVEAVKEAARAAGFDGYRYTDGPSRETQSNHVMMFDDSKMTPGQEFTANRDITPTSQPISPEKAIAQQKADELAKASDQQEQAQVRALKREKEAPVTSKGQLDPVTQAQVDQALATLKARAAADPQIAEEIAAIQRQAATDSQEAQALKDYAECLTESIT